jgi:hypothetical protein
LIFRLSEQSPIISLIKIGIEGLKLIKKIDIREKVKMYVAENFGPKTAERWYWNVVF